MKKTKNLMVYIIILMIVILLGVGLICIGKRKMQSISDTEQNTATPSSATLLDATPTDDIDSQLASGLDVSQKQVETDADAREDMVDITTEEPKKEKAIPPKVSLELELIYQHPELPTGCESVALTMLLNYYGFELEKTTIASEYLIYADNFVEGFVGNPFSSNGAGIYSPGLTRTANKFLDAQNSELNAKNITDSTPEEIYRYLAEGTPVVIWNTVYFLQNQPTGQVVKWGEKEYHWDRCEHCMVLSGYDLEKNVVIVHDPINGIVEREADGFWERYESLGSMALIIR